MNEEKAKLELNSLKWESGWRKILVPSIAIAVAFISGYFGYYLPMQQKLEDEAFNLLLQNLNDTIPINLQVTAIEELGNYGDRAYLPLRLQLASTKSKLIRSKIVEVLPDNYGFVDETESSSFREDIGEGQILAEWIYLGNYSYEHARWVDQTKNLGYTTTLEYNQIMKLQPSRLVGEEFKLAINVNTRSSFPYREGNVTQFAPKVGSIIMGEELKILELNETIHPNKNVKRIWVKVMRQD